MRRPTRIQNVTERIIPHVNISSTHALMLRVVNSKHISRVGDSLKSSGSDTETGIFRVDCADCFVIRKHFDDVLDDVAVIDESLAPKLQVRITDAKDLVEIIESHDIPARNRFS